MFVHFAQDYTPDVLRYMRQEPEEQEWATAGPKRDKSRSANNTARHAPRPLALFDRYCTEGKMLRSHIDDRQKAPLFITLLCCPATASCRFPALLTGVCRAHRQRPMLQALAYQLFNTTWLRVLLLSCAQCCFSGILSACGAKSTCCHLKVVFFQVFELHE